MDLHLNVLIPAETKRALEAEAKKRGTTISVLVRLAIQQWRGQKIDWNEAGYQEGVRRALADVKRSVNQHWKG